MAFPQSEPRETSCGGMHTQRITIEMRETNQWQKSLHVKYYHRGEGANK